jgi:hypothetical protein
MAPLPPGTPGLRSFPISRPASAEDSPPHPAPPPVWIRVGRGDIAALRHGLGLHERDALMALAAELLMRGEALGGGDEAWAEVSEAGAKWPDIRKKLERRSRIVVDGDILRIPWVMERLAEATESSTKARNAVSNRKDRRLQHG